MSELTMTTEYGTINNNNQEVLTMNKSEIVRQYVSEHPTPDQDLCPERRMALLTSPTAVPFVLRTELNMVTMAIRSTMQ